MSLVSGGSRRKEEERGVRKRGRGRRERGEREREGRRGRKEEGEKRYCLAPFSEQTQHIHS